MIERDEDPLGPNPEPIFERLNHAAVVAVLVHVVTGQEGNF